MSRYLDKLFNNVYEKPKLAKLIMNCDPDLKEQFRTICISKGITMTDALTKFMVQVVDESEVKNEYKNQY